MNAAQIRQKFLGYFERNGHSIIESSSLVPHNDPTLLFTNAGMVQFKDVFLGKDPRPYTRAATSQKVVRAGGKHNDLENVGFTARHHTFFEMLGNFSFGDYFKKEAIHYAWEFITKELNMPLDRLYVTVFEKDDEAADIWHKQEHVPKDRIYRFGEKDNFWSMGDTGPCGPCSEIFFDRGQKYGCKKPTCKMGCDCDRYMEFWNLVFMQYDRDASGKLTPLPKPSVDTGAGLERLAAILQDADTNYDTDVFKSIIEETAKIARKPYEKHSDLAPSFRVIADHARATTFLIGDGVMPSNEGRGYVLRRIIRRAIRHGKKLGFEGPFFSRVCGFVVEQMKDAYPDLIEKRTFIERACLAEEEQFLKTVDRGLTLLEEETQKLAGAKTLPGDIAFKLYDTFGFPLDLTRVICSEQGLAVDEAGFDKAMARQREESRKNWKGSGQAALDGIYYQLSSSLKAKGNLPQFVGYTQGQAAGQCVALLTQDDHGLHSVDSFTSIENAPIIEAIFNVTPFYGESGGQVGDQGHVTTSNGFLAQVVDVQRPVADLIVAHLKPVRGTLKVGEQVTQTTDHELRALTARNHTATHLLHWALREILGKHVKQSGSQVTPDLLRFDFTHFQAMTAAELESVETLINQRIWSSYSVSKREMKKDDAIAAGAIAMFGEKYSDVVRVVSVGDFSTELCGGTHIDHSSEIHLFKLASESGIAAGVRRIIAYTSKGAFNYLKKQETTLHLAQDRLKAMSPDDVIAKLDKQLDRERDLKRQIDLLQSKSASGEVDQFITQARPLSAGAILVSGICEPNAEGIKRLRDMAEKIKQKNPEAVIVLGMKDPDGAKANLLVAVGPKALGTYSASDILKPLTSFIDGRGGGKPDMAQAGGTKPQGLEAAIQNVQTQLK